MPGAPLQTQTPPGPLPGCSPGIRQATDGGWGYPQRLRGRPVATSPGRAVLALGGGCRSWARDAGGAEAAWAALRAAAAVPGRPARRPGRSPQRRRRRRRRGAAPQRCSAAPCRTAASRGARGARGHTAWRRARRSCCIARRGWFSLGPTVAHPGRTQAQQRQESAGRRRKGHAQKAMPQQYAN